MTAARRATDRFLAAVGARDARAAAACFTEDASYANVPHPPAVGRAAIEGLLGPILRRSERVRWDVVTASYTEERAWLERVDRFWIDGREHHVACNGVAEVDPARELITAFRDYVDLAPWRARIAGVLAG
ncbi:Limonene-1,2-epoxide hydrolase [Nonomuraea coxensis DSM 45129]|uniref:Limonene-1,2-epoxide hydrolase n=1 Tax=Nonomuraea coxensis DSM 45129 TaxID=1122611 RepID=A0ABX8UBR0_9ACTN|nr:limonene-1,2-epoxide hydrolase family protein [Nonomuraea coxensis]QYC45199.1 Limonene-1,2-epoxide hydrolase [Nonomuraea coxensis DSM 45129]